MSFRYIFDKIGNYIKDFFSTNLLAKLGSILVFLGVVFLLKGFVGDFWEVIGEKGRITVGILVGFSIYFAGMKIHKNSENEGLILMGTGILINFAVILSGRYLIGDDGYLAEGTTFIFLILNTVFGVLTSMIYKSKTLLVFSFIFAYLNPFIIGSDGATQPYTLIGYSLIVSLGALYISIREATLTLLALSFIFGNILFLVAPFSDSIGWSSKIILTSVFSIITIIGANKFSGINFNSKQVIIYLFSGAYLFIIANLIYSTTYINGEYLSILSTGFGAIIYNLIILGIFIFTVKIINSPIIPFHKGDEHKK
ncbi:MAG: DUF2339 domain-containing protein [Candidatus Gracilibacteria bacterium]|nr:DUF2339 domain-containing protein [Candidatus Gracilibacteria bacterium]